MDPSAAILPASARRPTVVVVDDDAALRAALAFWLEVEGFTVLACDSGEALLALALPPPPLCLLVDHRLGGITGLDALEALRGRGVASPAIVITATPGAVLSRRAENAGAEVVEKPLLGGDLLSAIRRRLRDSG